MIAPRQAAQQVDTKRMHALEQFKDPARIMGMIIDCFKEGDFESSTDFISAYIKHSPKYPTVDSFADKIGVTRQTLSRMFAHENVGLTVYFDCLNQIKEDIEA